MSDPPHRRKKKGLLGVFRGLRKRSKSREPSTTSTQDGSVPTRTSGGHTDGRPASLDSGQIQGVGQHQAPPVSPHTSPPIHVEDRSNHWHHGHTYNSTHNVQGVVNYVGTVTNAIFPSSGSDAALLWDSLPKQRDLSGQQSEYFEGSREDTVQYALTWGEDPNSEVALFIHGPAGVGKSTLARHLTHCLHASSRLAASVSLSGIPTDARGPESVVKLIAREIGEKHPEAMPAILEAIRLCKGAPLEDHFKRFLKDVVCSLKRSYPLTVVFDAVDEWESYGTLIKALPRLSSSASSLRFILLGRLDPRARGLDDASVHLYPLRPVSRGIMERYFGHQFNSICWDSGRCPSPSQTAELAELANGLFIWASIACSLLKKRLSLSSPNQTLEAILRSHRGLGDNDGLARLYCQAFVWLFPDSDAQELVRMYLGATLVLQEPLPITDFASLTDLPAHAAEQIQGCLTAFQIRQPTDHEGLCLVHPAGDLFHLSLLEYLQSTLPSTDTAFHISAFSAHSHLAESCLTKFPQLLPASRNISTHPLTPQEKYIVKYLAAHVYKGIPSVKLGSSTEWSRTRHHYLLQQLSVVQLHHWGNLLLDLVKPGSLIKEGEYTDNRGGLMRNIAVVLKCDLALRPFQIACLELAVRLQPKDVKTWHDLGWAYYQSAEYSKDINAGERAVLAHQNALDVVEESGSSDRATALDCLANSLHIRFKLLGNTQDLERSISLHQQALDLRPLGHKDRGHSLNNLSASLHSRLNLRDSVGNIEEVIELQRQALKLTPRGHVLHVSALQNLATALYSRFQTTASTADLDEAVQLGREALELCPPGHTDRAAALRSLAISLESHSQTTASTTDLDEAVQLRREVLKLRPPEHADRATALQRLAASLRSCSEMTASTSNLDEAVRLRREVLALCPPGHADRVTALRSLSYSLHSRFQNTSFIIDLDESIRLRREIVELRPPRHADRAAALQSLAISLQSRFETTALINDLDESIRICQEILAHCPLGHTDHAKHLNYLAWELALRYEAQGLMQDLKEAISLGRESLVLLPVGHPDRCYTLDTLAKALHFKPEHLDEALQLSQESVSIIPPGNRQGWEIRMTLATILLRHHKSSGAANELEEAISVCEEALSLCPPNHYLRPKLLRLQATLAEAQSLSSPHA